MKRSRANLRSDILIAAIAAIVLALPACSALDETTRRADLDPPSVRFGEFFRTVAMSGLFADSKQWTDAVPRVPPEEILARAADVDTGSVSALGEFVNEYFDLDPASDIPAAAATLPHARSGQRPPVCQHIAALWPVLTRDAAEPEAWSSRLPLPNPYVVPGGRFREVYYWDSYFTMLGLGPAQADLKRNMVMNFAHQVRTYGHIPNGNRTYYLSRSQPPFFYKMVGLLTPGREALSFAEFLPELRAEHDFWTQGSEQSAPGRPVRRVVTLPDGSQLNRYWDDRDVPRDESYREDVEAAEQAGHADRARFYRDIRAAAESGWDFSSRWFADGESIETTRTTSVVPVDLNSLLYGLEQAIAAGCRETGDRACASRYEALAQDRRSAMHRYLWNDETGIYDDYLWTERRLLGHVTAATLYPLFVGLATDSQADSIAAVLRERLLADGGVVTTTRDTGQQWDAPNGWAPLQWIAVTGLRNYDHPELAEEIARRWLTLVTNVYRNTGKLLEKYNVVNLLPGGGGEYPLQDGFGWTNGVTVGLYGLYPSEECPSASAITETPIGVSGR